MKLIYDEVDESMKDARARENYLHSGVDRQDVRNCLKIYLSNL